MKIKLQFNKVQYSYTEKTNIIRQPITITIRDAIILCLIEIWPQASVKI